ncbi:cyclin B1 interacting protein 1, E3 ubiquitin protein ligase [Podila clonocystis]|nr:cyclin B1 interacting protein 1, E3 ubiquitin protein ligase [Podila clonocystis]
MKKLSIALAEGDRRGFLFPGDTISGQVTFVTSSVIKYTCVKINFIGLVSTKVAKSEDQVYIFNQQVVLQGNANNATEDTIDEGNHTWDFTFAVPLQHIPTSGKYRHGSVKYYLIATVTSPGFLGAVQEIRTEKPVILKDLINIQMSPYSDPVSMTGSDSTTGNRDPIGKATAVATVRLSRSAYLKGQVVDIEIDLSHPSKIARNPGCWIQLMRKDRAKEYSASVAACSEPLRVESSMRTGKIMATLTVPDDALPSMTTTKIITIQYHLLLLFDMRTKTPFMESRSPKKMNNKLRNKLLGSPGGFQVEVPVIIGTLSDNLAGHRLHQTISPSQPAFKPSTSPPIRQLNYGYPLEKCMSPPHINMPLPISVSVEMPTAPQAVDLGFGPASPSIDGGMRKLDGMADQELKYVFCVPCANKSFEAALVCPACETSLTQPDDIGFVDLNPSQEYKSSILSGLRPEVIMEICTRGLSFWTYQTSQEARYQEMTQKNLEDKLSVVEKQHQWMTREMNAELTGFRDTVGTLQRDLEQEKRKAIELSEQVEEKTRQLSRLQTTFDRIKRRPLFSTPDMPMPMSGPLDTDVHGGNPFSSYPSHPMDTTPHGFISRPPLMSSFPMVHNINNDNNFSSDRPVHPQMTMIPLVRPPPNLPELDGGSAYSSFSSISMEPKGARPQFGAI